MTELFQSSTTDHSDHEPVLIEEVCGAINPKDGETYIDGTLGAGGYSRAILDRADCRVIAFDRDPDAIKSARGWADAYGERLVLIEAPFASLKSSLLSTSTPFVDGVMLDIGVSSMQLDQVGRGFSFLRDGPLSMRMDQAKPDAATVIREATLGDLAAIFRVYGEEKRAASLARAIINARAETAIETTGALASVISDATPVNPRKQTKSASKEGSRAIHPATRAFQALRIYVNDELGQLAEALIAVEETLAPEGRLAVVTFHSLEDRIVKRFLADRSVDPATQGSRHAPPVETKAPSFVLRSMKPIGPTDSEIDRNPRARSAKLRVATRTDAPARGGEPQEFYSMPRLSRDYLH